MIYEDWSLCFPVWHYEQKKIWKKPVLRLMLKFETYKLITVMKLGGVMTFWKLLAAAADPEPCNYFEDFLASSEFWISTAFSLHRWIDCLNRRGKQSSWSSFTFTLLWTDKWCLQIFLEIDWYLGNLYFSSLSWSLQMFCKRVCNFINRLKSWQTVNSTGAVSSTFKLCSREEIGAHYMFEM